jgi:hypothetical protein
MSAGQLTLSGANLLLRPYHGNVININGVDTTIPSAGVTLAPTGLTVGTLYYIYAWLNAGVLTLEASTTGHSVNATTGVETKTGDATRTLVGMARPITGPAWSDTLKARFVASWFNRRVVALGNSFTTGRATASASQVEVHSEIRIEWLTWADEAVALDFCAQCTADVAAVTQVSAFGIDGAVLPAQLNMHTSTAPAFYMAHTIGHVAAFSEGYHWATVMGQMVGGGTGTWQPGFGLSGLVRI